MIPVLFVPHGIEGVPNNRHWRIFRPAQSAPRVGELACAVMAAREMPGRRRLGLWAQPGNDRRSGSMRGAKGCAVGAVLWRGMGGRV